MIKSKLGKEFINVHVINYSINICKIMTVIIVFTIYKLYLYTLYEVYIQLTGDKVTGLSYVHSKCQLSHE